MFTMMYDNDDIWSYIMSQDCKLEYSELSNNVFPVFSPFLFRSSHKQKVQIQAYCQTAK